MDKLDAGRLKAAVFDWDGTLAETRTPGCGPLIRINGKIRAAGLGEHPRKAEQTVVFHG